MTLLGTIFTATSGLLTHSKGLGVISDNVANMNTPGFKRSDLLFRDLVYHYETSGGAAQGGSTRRDGNGVGDLGTRTSYVQGDIQSSGNDTDVAIDGNGLLIFREKGETFYSRAGQLLVDEQGYLVSTLTSARLAGLDGSGRLVDINIAALRTNPAKATEKVVFVGNLSSDDTEHVINDIDVFDAEGGQHTLSMTARNNGNRSWLIEVKDAAGAVVASDLEIRFQPGGSPEVDFNSVKFQYTPTGASPLTVELHMGEPGGLGSVTSFAGGTTSSMSVQSVDGYTFGIQTKVAFDADGRLSIEYSNGKSAEAGQLALAWTSKLQALRQIGNGMMTIDSAARMQVSAPGQLGMGKITGGSVETSNVDISQEFSDLIVVQRGFQVSSQVVTIANEMIQQLLDSASSRR